MPGVEQTPTFLGSSGGASFTVATPAEHINNPGGVDDKLVAFAGYANSTSTTPTAPRKQVAVIGKALTSNVATLTATEHGWTGGESVTIAGVDATFNGTYTITTVTTNTFSYAKTASDVAQTSAAGTATGATAEAGWALSEAALVGGGGTYGLDDGPRGVVAWERITTGSEMVDATTSRYTWIVDNGGSGSDRAIRGGIYRCTRVDLTWQATVGDTDEDTSLSTTLNVQPGVDPTSSTGDLVIIIAAWPQNGLNVTTGVTNAITWPGAVAATTTQLGPTGPTANGNHVRVNSYFATVVGAATGNWEGILNFGGNVTGVGMLLRIRATGSIPVADPGGDLVGLEPGRPFQLDGSFSDGNIATYTWEKETSPGVWSAVAGSGAIRTIDRATASVDGVTEKYRLKVTDVNAVDSAWVEMTAEINGTTERFHDSGGTVRWMLKDPVT